MKMCNLTICRWNEVSLHSRRKSVTQGFIDLLPCCKVCFQSQMTSLNNDNEKTHTVYFYPFLSQYTCISIQYNSFLQINREKME